MDYMVTVHRGSSVYDLARPTVFGCYIARYVSRTSCSVRPMHSVKTRQLICTGPSWQSGRIQRLDGFVYVQWLCCVFGNVLPFIMTSRR